MLFQCIFEGEPDTLREVLVLVLVLVVVVVVVVVDVVAAGHLPCSQRTNVCAV